MTAAPEFSRIVRADQVRRMSAETHIEADAAEREALVRRFGLSSLDQLEADYGLSEEKDTILARGHMRAVLAQPCVATGEPVPETIDTEFSLRFVVEADEELPVDEELDAQDVDTIGYDGQAIDMGEAVAETMALAMTPFPRSSNADAVLKKAGVLSEEQASPFAALLALKDKG